MIGVRKEPLKQFVAAKQGMGIIYTNLGSFVTDLASIYTGEWCFVDKYTFFSDLSRQYSFVSSERVSDMGRYRESTKQIKELFSRDNMKVVFFGR